MNIKNLENNARKYVSSLGNFLVLEYQSDSFPFSSITIWRLRTPILLIKYSFLAFSGATEAGHVKATTGIKGVGDFVGKMVKGDHKGDSSQTGIRRQRHSGVRTYL